MNEAEGYANEVLPRARAEAAELRASALGYRDAKIADAQGERTRFLALLTEYREGARDHAQAPLPRDHGGGAARRGEGVVEPGTAQVLPYLPLGPGAPVAPAAPVAPKGER